MNDLRQWRHQCRPYLEWLAARILPSFLPAVNYPTGASPNVVVTGDFDNDGNLDFALTDTGSTAVSVYLGNGDGNFQAPRTFATGRTPWSLAAADLTGNGILDLVVTDLNGGSVSVLLGNGDGTFKPKMDFPTTPFPQDVKVADLNGDGIPDLIVSALGPGTGNSQINVLLGNGDGTFQPHLDTPVASYPGFMAVTQVNGTTTLVVPTYEENSGLELFASNGDGTFQPPTVLAAGTDPTWVDTGDFNGDGLPDLVVSNNVSPGGTVQVFLANPDGSFQPAVPYAVGDAPESVAVGDFNNDGVLDLAVANDETGVTVLLGNGNGTFGSRADYAAGHVPAAAVGDFNGDGFSDLVVANYGDSTVSVLINAADWNGPGVPRAGLRSADLFTPTPAPGPTRGAEWSRTATPARTTGEQATVQTDGVCTSSWRPIYPYHEDTAFEPFVLMDDPFDLSRLARRG
jgi:hypothetical protein